MKKYERPVVDLVDGVSEGIFAASGDEITADNTTQTTKCKSAYMNGQFVVGTYNPIRDGYKVGRGCEGCPANWGRCAVNEVNYDGDFRPSWEVQGKLPDEKGY